MAEELAISWIVRKYVRHVSNHRHKWAKKGLCFCLFLFLTILMKAIFFVDFFFQASNAFENDGMDSDAAIEEVLIDVDEDDQPEVKRLRHSTSTQLRNDIVYTEDYEYYVESDRGTTHSTVDALTTGTDDEQLNIAASLKQEYDDDEYS